MNDLIIYNYSDYRKFLSKKISGLQPLRGAKARFAEAANCQPSYFSQVLAGHVHLTPEQAYDLSEYMSLGEDQSEYFLKMVDLARAGTQRLQQKIRAELTELRSCHTQLGKVLARPSRSENTQSLVYFRHWLLVAVHLSTSMGKTVSTAQIADRLRISLSLAEGTLKELKTLGLVRQVDGGWQFMAGDIHVDKGDPALLLHHNNWRQVAMMRFMEQRKSDVQFTGVYAGSEVAMQAFHMKLVTLIREFNALVGESNSEKLICFTCDLFDM